MEETLAPPAPTKGAGGAMMRVRRDRVRPNPRQPRKWFDPRAHAELVKSIGQSGILQPLRVREDPELGPGWFEIIAGERRWRASGEVGLEEIPVVLADVADDRRVLLQATTENVIRADMTPIEEAGAYRDLLAHDMTVEEISAELGKSPGVIRARLVLLELIPEAQDAVAKNLLPVTLGVEAAAIAPDAQAILLRRWVTGGFSDVPSAVAYARACKEAENQPVMFGELESYPQAEAKQQAKGAASRASEPLVKATTACYRIARLDPAAVRRGLTDLDLEDLMDKAAKLAAGLTELRRVLRQAKAHGDANPTLALEIPEGGE